MRSFLMSLCCALALLASALAPAARAQSLDAAIEKLQTDEFSDTVDAIALIASSGHPRAGVILQAMNEGQLSVDPNNKALFIVQGDKTLDALTGEPVASPPADLTEVRTNNRVRGQLAAAIGALSLMNPDPAKRLAAAEAVFKARDIAARPALDTALAAEKDPKVKDAMETARAALLLVDEEADLAERIKAVDVIRDKGNATALGLLTAFPPSRRR